MPEVKTQVVQLKAEVLKAFAIWGQPLLDLDTGSLTWWKGMGKQSSSPLAFRFLLSIMGCPGSREERTAHVKGRCVH